MIYLFNTILSMTIITYILINIIKKLYKKILTIIHKDCNLHVGLIQENEYIRFHSLCNILNRFLKLYIENNKKKLDNYKPENIDIPENINLLNVPDEFKCPISKCIMKNPVLISDGYTYEREYLERYINEKQFSPISNSPLIFPYIIPNWNLRKLIVSYIEKCPIIDNEYENKYLKNYDKELVNIISIL